MILGVVHVHRVEKDKQRSRIIMLQPARTELRPCSMGLWNLSSRTSFKLSMFDFPPWPTSASSSFSHKFPRFVIWDEGNTKRRMPREKKRSTTSLVALLLDRDEPCFRSSFCRKKKNDPQWARARTWIVEEGWKVQDKKQVRMIYMPPGLFSAPSTHQTWSYEHQSNRHRLLTQS